MSTLLIQSSARTDASVSRELATRIAESLGGDIALRDLAQGVELVTEHWVTHRGKTADEYDATDAQVFAQSDALIAELKAADAIVIGVSMYNFAIPAALKAWIDLVARPNSTFSYATGAPEGLLKGKRAWIAVASDGVPVGSDMDFLTGYLKFALGFIGITEVEVIAADALKMNPGARDAALASAAALAA